MEQNQNDPQSGNGAEQAPNETQPTTDATASEQPSADQPETTRPESDPQTDPDSKDPETTGDATEHGNEDLATEREPMTDDEKVIAIARACHNVNKSWCEINGDHTQKSWEEAENWQRESAVKGVQFRLANPNGGVDAQHNAWMADKFADGWIYGEEKDADKKTHPCLVHFAQLPIHQQVKDKLFCGIVDAMSATFNM